MKQKLFFKGWLYFCSLFTTIIFISSSALYSQSGWFQQNSGTTNTLYGVSFVNANTGFAGGSGGLILKTTNGGNNWQSFNIGSNSNITRIQFLNALTGYVSSSGGIKKSTDGGLTWNATSWAGTNPISFVDVSTGFTFSYIQCIYTSNGGLNWYNGGSFGNQNPTMLDIFFINSQTGYMCGSECHIIGHYSFGYAVIGKTTNGGLNWYYSLSAGNTGFCSGAYVNKLFFLNDAFGVAVGHNGDVFLRTTNAGLNWSLLQFPARMSSIYFATVNSGWMCGDSGKILFTSDGGNNWINQNLIVNSIFNEISMVNQYTGWVVGSSGKIFKTTTGGAVGIETISSTVPGYFALYQNYPNPFNPVTKIKFAIPRSPKGDVQVYDSDGPKTRGEVRVIVYDILGREIVTLVNEQLSPGTYEVTFDGSDYTSAVYYYTIEAGEYKASKKMVLVK